MEFLNSILNNIDEALITTDARGKVLYYNEVALNLSAEILKTPLQTGDNIVQALKVLDESIHENFYDIRTRKRSFSECPNSKGSILFLELNFIPVINELEELTHIHVFIRDTTPQKIFEQRLVGQATNISNLIDKANAIIIGVDTRGYITDWNEYCSKITGFEKGEVYAKKFSEVLLTKGEKYFDELLAKVLVNESVSNYEISIRIKSKKKAIFLLSGTHRTNSSGEVIGVLFVGQDVTELTEYRKSLEKKVEERTHALQQALLKEKEVIEMKSRFISIASHEFRTPLSSIEHAANFLKSKSGLFTTDNIHTKIETIDKQVKHMMSLLDDVLTYGKSEAGKIQLILSTVSLNEFFVRIVEDVCQGTKNTHEIETAFHDLPSEIQTDEKLFRNIFTNLLTNAIKFSPERQKVFLTIRYESNCLEVSVRDEGIGIPEGELDKVFEPFIRGSGVGSIQGTGLGLSIVKKSVELLQGTIQAQSQVNAGTTFAVKIPIHESK